MDNIDIKKINKNLEIIDDNFDSIINVISDDRGLLYSVYFTTLLNTVALIYIIHMILPLIVI